MRRGSEERTMPAEARGMTCMEIRGGNRALRQEVEAPGLVGWIDSAPYKDACGGGGDVYYVSNCATGRITRLLLADVSGHGAAVARTADRLRTLMRRYVNHVSQGGFVRALNAEFSVVTAAGGFATAVAASFFAPQRLLTVSVAGHPPPLLRLGGTWQAFDPAGDRQHAGLPLGLHDEAEYGEAEIPLAPGDMALLYSDAWMEARQPDGSQLGIEGLLAAVRALPDGSPRALGDALRAEVARRHPENLLDDDATLVLVQATGAGTTVPLRNRALAPWRLLAGVGQALLEGGRGLPFPEFSWRNLGLGLSKRPPAKPAATARR